MAQGSLQVKAVGRFLISETHRSISYMITWVIILLLSGCAGIVMNKNVGVKGTNNGLEVSSAEILHLAEDALRNCQEVGGFKGAGIVPTRFLKLSVIFVNYGTPPLFERFLSDENPVVRAMGLVCLSQTDCRRFAELFSKYTNDTARLDVYTSTCQPIESSVAKLAIALYEAPNYLGQQFDYGNFQAYATDIQKGTVSVMVHEARNPVASQQHDFERDAMVQHLQGIVLPSVDWLNTPIENAVGFLERECGGGVNGKPRYGFIVRFPPGMSPGEITITYAAKKVTAYQALAVIANVCALRWSVQDGNIILTPTFASQED